MKFILSFFVFCSFLLFPQEVPATVKADTLTTYAYARVENSSTYFYSFPQDNISDNALFVIPESYFVLLLSNFNDSFYKAQYRDLVGYVLKDEVSPVAETPQNPFLEDFTFWVFSSDGRNLYSVPSSSDGMVTTTAVLHEEIDYYGAISGEEMVSGRGTTWFFCKVNDIYGYLYEGLCDTASTVTLNTEVVTYVSNPFEDDNSYLYNLVEMTSGLKILVLFLLIVPALFLIYLLFKPFKLEHKTEKIKQHSKAQTIKQIQDFYDDSL